jgi:hypothetical protein
MFLDEIRFTMEMLGVQREFRLGSKIPSIDKYWAYRDGSCCINAMVALVELGFRLPLQPGKIC